MVPGGLRWERRGRRDAFLGIIGEHSLATLFCSTDEDEDNFHVDSEGFVGQINI